MKVIYPIFILILCITAVAFSWTRQSHKNKVNDKKHLLHRDRVDQAILLDIAKAAINSGSSVPNTLSVLGKAIKSETADNPDDILALQLEQTARKLLYGGSWEECWKGNSIRLQPLKDALEPAWVDGVAPEPLIVRAADGIRKSRVRRAHEAAQRLGVKIVLPLGLCYLPSFVFLGIVPAIIGAVKIFT